MVAVIAGVLAGIVGLTGLVLRLGDDADPSPAAAAAAPVGNQLSTPGPDLADTVSPAPIASPSTPGPASTTPADGTGKGTNRTAEPIKVPAHGPGTYRRAKVDLAAPKGHGRVIRFDVRVEKGLALDPATVAREIHRTLADKRSWRRTDHVRFQLVSDPDRARLHAYIVTPGTTDRLCYPWLTRGAVSCQNGNRVVLNAKRWVYGAKAYKSDAAAYREYLVNHEFGHALGYNHVRCPGKGRNAPVMMQQTKGLGGCRANPWPSVARR